MMIVHRFCQICNKITKWTVQPAGSFWERYTCKKCGTTHESKTK